MGPDAVDGPWVTFVSYAYDARGNLVAVTDGDGHTTRFAYDDAHRMTEQHLPTGLCFHYRYDDEGRCIETWGDHEDGADPSLAADVPSLLADGRTQAKGIHHCVITFGEGGYSEVTTSTGSRRFFGNAFGKPDKAVAGGGVTTSAFDALGCIISRTNPVGATVAWTRDERGSAAATPRRA